MKIKSIVDVITNSSTEVFTLNTKLSLGEVKKILKEILLDGGYKDPEIMKKGKGVLKELEEFGYLYDPNKQEDMDRYYIDVFRETEKWTDDGFELVPIEHAEELQEAWSEFVWKNRDRINNLFKKNCKWYSDSYEKIPDTGQPRYAYQYISAWDIFYIPGIVREFLNDYSGPYPETFKLPQELTIDYWVGKIGFSGTSDNSIDFDKFEAVNKILDGTNWHLG